MHKSLSLLLLLAWLCTRKLDLIPFWPLFWRKMGHFSSNRKCSRRPSGIKGLELLLLRTSCSHSQVVWIKDGGLAFLCMWGPPAAALFFPQRAPEQTEKWEGKENDLNYLKVPRGGDAHVNYASSQTPMSDRHQCSCTNHLCNGKVAWIWTQKKLSRRYALELHSNLFGATVWCGQCSSITDESSVSFNPGILVANPTHYSSSSRFSFAQSAAIKETFVEMALLSFIFPSICPPLKHPDEKT